MKKFKKRLPSGRIALRTRRRKAGIRRCANCGKELHGIPRLHPAEVGKLAKTRKSVERAFGGYYCSACSRELLRERVRGMI